jgi:methionyl-tRNA formyltransferase
MTKTSSPVVFFGNERLATGVHTEAPTLRRLIAAGYIVAAVITNYEAGASRNVRDLEVAAVAAEHHIPVIINQKPGDIIDQLQSFGAVAGVLVAYGQIVPQKVIDLFPRGIVNIHPSLLPLHRGPTPIESAILQGETQTGVSLMRLSKAMDAGPVYGQQTVALDGTESKASLTSHLLDIGGEMLMQLLPAILDGTAPATPQEDSQATYDERITKPDGLIDWQKPAERLEREIRAYADWPKSRTTFNNLDVTITAAHVVDLAGKPGTLTIDKKQLVVHCGDQALAIDRLVPAGKKEMPIEAFLAGYRSLL